MPRATGSCRDHYLPQMHLRRWATVATPPQTGYVYVYRRGSAEPKRRSPKKLAYRRGLYDVDPRATTDGNRRAVEEAFGRFESGASGAFSRILDTGTLSAPTAVVRVASFVALMLVRTPHEMRRVAHWNDVLAYHYPEQVLKSGGGEPDLHRFLTQIGEPAPGLTGAALRDRVREVSRRLASGRERRFDQLFRVAQRVTEVLARMRWCVVSNDHTDGFITGDVPVLVTGQRPDRDWWAPSEHGIQSPDAEVWFPLSPRTLLVASAKEMPRARHATPELVRLVNSRVAAFSYEFVVASSESDEIAHAMADLRPREDDQPPAGTFGDSADAHWAATVMHTVARDTFGRRNADGPTVGGVD